MITNPFTGMVINANPRGDNQYVNPDGVSSKFAAHDRLGRLKATALRTGRLGDIKYYLQELHGQDHISPQMFAKFLSDNLVGDSRSKIEFAGERGMSRSAAKSASKHYRKLAKREMAKKFR